jgi:hypothetical protein
MSRYLQKRTLLFGCLSSKKSYKKELFYLVVYHLKSLTDVGLVNFFQDSSGNVSPTTSSIVLNFTYIKESSDRECST